MKTLLSVCAVCALLLSVTAAVAPPFAGTWQGERNGLKSATVTIRTGGEEIEGEVVFWVDRDRRTAGMDERRLIGPRWDGKVLRFSVGPTDMQPGAPVFDFAMTLTGHGTALLTRLKGNGAEELSIPLRKKQRRGGRFEPHGAVLRGTINPCAGSHSRSPSRSERFRSRPRRRAKPTNAWMTRLTSFPK